jgi:two-component system, OmpR family, copper resistance phosphate regulon response regulator CusR
VKLLLVEDEIRIASFVMKGLTSSGYRVEHAASGRDGIARLAGAPYDLVLLDLGLPDIDGLEVLQQLRDGGTTVPVIVLTARTDARDEALRLGADEFLAKPLAFSQLLELVRAQAEAKAGPRA